MRIGTSEDAKSVVRKYFLGTRTSHGKIATLSVEEETEGPDEKGAWKVKGTYLTEAGVRAQFVASCVLTRGGAGDHFEFDQTETALALGILKCKPDNILNSSVGESVLKKLSRADYRARKRQKKKQGTRKSTKSSRNPS